MRVILIHQFDPDISHASGISTFIRTFIKYAPADFDLAVVGVTADPASRPLGRWHRLNVEGRAYEFLPIVAAHPTHRRRVPLSLRLTWALSRYRDRIDVRGAVLEYHRIEPILALRDLPNPKVLFLHAHMQDLYNPKTEVMWGKAPWLYFWLERRLIASMDKIYLVREDAVPWYRQRYPALASRIAFLPTWVDDEVFVSFPEEDRLREKRHLAHRYGFEPTNRLLLFVGRFEGQKDPLLLLNAFRHLNGSMTQTRLVMIGEGALEAQIRAFVAANRLERHVVLLGSQSQPELARWMNAADCLILSSAFEGMPRVAVEALACGLPVVSTDVGEVPRLIREEGAGRLVSQRTPEAFGAAIAEVLRQRPSHETCQRQILPYTAAKVLTPVYEAYRALRRGSA